MAPQRQNTFGSTGSAWYNLKMIVIRKSADRGHADHGWLKAKHSFSFADYYDPAYMGFRSLRVINEDRIDPGMGFATHGHKEMEIISYMVGGALEHKDSMGNGSIIVPSEVQYMSAGTGVRHSEFNPSSTEIGHLLQIWVVPNKTGVPPRYGQKKFPIDVRTNQLKLVVVGEDEATAKDKSEAILIRQDARVYASLLTAGNKLEHKVTEDRGCWLQLIKGEITLNGNALSAGDAAAVEGESLLKIEANKDAEFLLFDLK